MPRALPLFLDTAAVGLTVEYAARFHRHAAAVNLALASLVLVVFVAAILAHYAERCVRNFEASHPDVTGGLRAEPPELDGDELWCRILERSATVPDMPRDELIPWLVEHSDTRVAFPHDFDPRTPADE
jgi:hypothetical protein